MDGKNSTAELVDEETAKSVPQAVILRPWLSERIWGVTELPAFLEQPKPGHPVGEAWLTALDCVAEEQDHATLGELTRRWPEAFGAQAGAEFPLLIKLLFPREKLSVQVHPNDEQARAIGQPRGKNECWYVLSAEPGAQIALGLHEEMAPEEIERAIHGGTLESRLHYLPVKAGDMVYVEAGTIHAIGPGVVILETQQYSDTTYRLYDYGRPRELHLKQGLAVTRSQTASGLVDPVEHDGFTTLIRSPYFVVDRFRLAPGSEQCVALPGKMQILIALENGASMRLSALHTVALPAGHAIILPAKECAEEVLVGAAEVEVIRVTAVE